MDLQKLNKMMIEMKQKNQLDVEVDGIKMAFVPVSFQGKINTGMFGCRGM